MIDIYKILKEKSVPQDPVKREIKKLKSQLEQEDYKIIKCMEYQLAGKELPYDIEELNQIRDGIREQINELESKEG
jgi:hypothetical protein